jgi:fructose-1,6-bisphosphatase I
MKSGHVPTRTLQRVIREQERKFPESTGELSGLISSIAMAVKILRDLVATAEFRGLHGYSGRVNVQGERTYGLDEEADKVLVDILSSTGHFGSLVSEERDTAISVDVGGDEGKYVVAFDPLDGSSNIGSSIPVGTIFGIFRKRTQSKRASERDFLQAGHKLTAAGYALYGAKTSFVYSTGQGVFDFTLDPAIGEFILTGENLMIPWPGATLSVNEANSPYWGKRLRDYVSSMKLVDNPRHSCRYVGSLVADFDRTIRKGGIFLYPTNKKHPEGKLRLLYECMPLAFIIEQAGGLATDGQRRILDIVPERIHQRSGFVFGNKDMVEDFTERVTLPAKSS